MGDMDEARRQARDNAVKSGRYWECDHCGVGGYRDKAGVIRHYLSIHAVLPL